MLPGWQAGRPPTTRWQEDWRRLDLSVWHEDWHRPDLSVWHEDWRRPDLSVWRTPGPVQRLGNLRSSVVWTRGSVQAHFFPLQSATWPANCPRGLELR